jgi:hypothetical protein
MYKQINKINNIWAPCGSFDHDICYIYDATKFAEGIVGIIKKLQLLGTLSVNLGQ